MIFTQTILTSMESLMRKFLIASKNPVEWNSQDGCQIDLHEKIR